MLRVRDIKTFFFLLSLTSLLCGCVSKPKGPKESDWPAAKPKEARSTDQVLLQDILFLSDYAGKGYGVSSTEATPAHLQSQIETQGWPFTLLDYSRQGESLPNLSSRIPYLAEKQFQAVIIVYGGTDYPSLIDPQLVRNQLLALIESLAGLHRAGEWIIVNLDLNREQPEETKMLRQLLLEVAHIKNGRFVDVGAASLQEGILLPDGRHLTSEGHRVVAAEIWKTLKPTLEGRLKDYFQINSQAATMR